MSMAAKSIGYGGPHDVLTNQWNKRVWNSMDNDIVTTSASVSVSITTDYYDEYMNCYDELQDCYDELDDCYNELDDCYDEIESLKVEVKKLNKEVDHLKLENTRLLGFITGLQSADSQSSTK